MCGQLRSSLSSKIILHRKSQSKRQNSIDDLQRTQEAPNPINRDRGNQMPAPKPSWSQREKRILSQILHMQKLVYKFVNILSAMTHPFPPAGISEAQKLLTRLRMLALTCPGMQTHQILLQLLMRLTPVVLPDSTTTPLNDDPGKRTGSCHGFKTLHHSRNHERQPATALSISLLSTPLFKSFLSSQPNRAP